MPTGDIQLAGGSLRASFIEGVSPIEESIVISGKRSGYFIQGCSPQRGARANTPFLTSAIRVSTASRRSSRDSNSLSKSVSSLSAARYTDLYGDCSGIAATINHD